MPFENPFKNQQLFETIQALSMQADPKEYRWICFDWGENPRQPNFIPSHTMHIIQSILQQYVDWVCNEQEIAEIEKEPDRFYWSDDVWVDEPNPDYDEMYYTCLQMIAYINQN
jgi:hypothetical protein